MGHLRFWGPKHVPRTSCQAGGKGSSGQSHTGRSLPAPPALGPITLVGEPRMGGRGLRCRKSGSLGEPRKGRQDCSPWAGCGGLDWGWPNATPRGSVGGLGNLGRTTCRSDRLGALCRRQPSPAACAECSGAEEPGAGQDKARSLPCGARPAHQQEENV